MLYSISQLSSRNTGLPLQTVFIGNTNETRSKTDASGSKYYEFIYCEEGEGTIHAGDVSGFLFPGQFLFLVPDTSSFRTPSSRNWKLWHLALTGPCCREILAACGFEHAGIYGLPAGNCFIPFMERLLKAHADN